MLEKTRLCKTWRMVVAAEAGEIQSNKIAKTRKLKNTKPRMSYQVAFAKAGAELPFRKLEKTCLCMTGEIPEKSKAEL